MQPHKNLDEIEHGALFRRHFGPSMSEIAEVIDTGQDRMGITHVRFHAHMMRGKYATAASEQRTLSLESFHARYNERVQLKRKSAEAQ